MLIAVSTAVLQSDGLLAAVNSGHKLGLLRYRHSVFMTCIVCYFSVAAASSLANSTTGLRDMYLYRI